MMRPLILIDVDGVLNPEFSAKTRRRLGYHEGWIRRKVTVTGRDVRLFVNPEHGRWLRGLAQETGAELAWASTWEDWANICVGPLLGLPRLAYAPAPAGMKSRTVPPWTAGRRFVWFEDDPLVIRGVHASQPHLMVAVDETTGLTDDHVSRAREWLEEEKWITR